MQSQLDTVISNNLERELRGISDRIGDAVAPYSRFVELERKKVAESTEKLKTLRQTVRDIRKKLN
jgi:polyhydroxyalkanoate synthesis regulator phasin